MADIIYSHGHCSDGFCAALIAKRRYPNAEVVFLDHGADHAENLKKAEGKDVLMLDFSLRTREENDRLAASARNFLILDHHKTAEAVLASAPYAIFDMKRSGAGLAWDYLFGEVKLEIFVDGKPTGEFIEAADPQPRPWYVDYVEDRDLWNWKLENSREVCAYLGTLEFEFEKWEFLDKIDPYTAFLRGTGALAHINHYVREAVKQAIPGSMFSLSTAVLNVPYLNCSEVGNELAKTYQVSLTWFVRGDGIVQFSLRSIGDIDVSAIAKKFNGGGHKNAAGFQLPFTQAMDVIDRAVGKVRFAEPTKRCVS